jgi:hypothetical protein
MMIAVDFHLGWVAQPATSNICLTMFKIKLIILCIYATMYVMYCYVLFSPFLIISHLFSTVNMGVFKPRFKHTVPQHCNATPFHHKKTMEV